jgi:ABC-type polar amino acid transport system ATPase subunit
VKGLDALMLALKTWNGGVIIISHDERFITTVADEVCFCSSRFLLILTPRDSCGSAEMAQSASSKAMSRCIRHVVSASGSVEWVRLLICDLQSLIVSNIKARP